MAVADLSYPTSKTRRGRVEDGGQICPTITTTGGLYVFEEETENLETKEEFMKRVKIRKLLPEETFILQGMTVEDCQKCRDIGLSDSALYKVTGNGLISNCVALIAEHLYKAFENENYVCYDENFQSPDSGMSNPAVGEIENIIINDRGFVNKIP